MSSLLALLGPAALTTPDAEAERLLAHMSARGTDARETWRGDEALLAAARDRWEMEPGFAGPTMVAERGPLRVVCDATLYYVADLRAKLERAGAAPASDSAADLVAAAYAAFGARCLDHLEGDFAFCVWDADARTLFCGRDPFGARSLFHTTRDGTLAVASTPHPLVAWRGAEGDFDPDSILRALLLRPGDGRSTPWRGIHEVPAAHCLVATSEGVRVERYWSARGVDRWRALSSDEAVEALRGLLDDAARERSLPGSTALAMSGGMDSTAIMASLPDTPPDVLSFRFPEGDPQDESWYVEEVADAFGMPVRWVPIDGIGMYEGAEARARVRSQCHGHVFEAYNRTIARTAAEMGDRVLLNGHGGDNVMAVGPWQMADLLRRGRLLALRRFRAARGYRGRRHFVEYVVRPALPLPLLDALEPLLRRRLCTRPFERPVPSWIHPDPDALTRITRADRREYRDTIVRGRWSVVEQQRAWGLMDSNFGRGCAAIFDLSRDMGVELRMPFYDRRLVEFSMSRPPEELDQPGRYKVLLQKAMSGRLPKRDRRIQPGGFKPGTAAGIMESLWPAQTVAATRRLGAPWISESLGLVDRERFVREVSREGALRLASAVDVSLTVFVEIWLRAHAATPTT